MKRKIPVFLFILAIGAIALLATACNSEKKSVSARNTLKNSNFKIVTPAPQRYENVEGLPLYSVAPDITERLAALGPQAPSDIKAFFLMLNPRSPAEAILVKAPSDIPEAAVKSQASSIIVVTGDVKSVSCEPLASYIKENVGAQLALTDDGSLAYIDMETPLDFNIINKASNSEKAAQQVKKVEAPAEGNSLNAPQEGNSQPSIPEGDVQSGAEVPDGTSTEGQAVQDPGQTVNDSNVSSENSNSNGSAVGTSESAATNGENAASAASQAVQSSGAVSGEAPAVAVEAHPAEAALPTPVSGQESPANNAPTPITL